MASAGTLGRSQPARAPRAAAAPRAGAAPPRPRAPRRRGRRAAGAADVDAVPASMSAADVEDAEDLWQHPDRDQWYAAKFCADDQPDWQPATLVSSTDAAPGVREVVLDVEISRELVPLRNAYRHVGQRAAVRVAGGAEQDAPCASAPPAVAANADALLRVRGDIAAYETKTATDALSVRARVAVLATQDGCPELYAAVPGESAVEVGPFRGAGLDLRGPAAAVFLYRTLVLFVETPAGAAAARALLEATPDVGGLSLPLRDAVRVYYRAPNEAATLFRDRFAGWEAASGGVVKVVTSTRDSFSDMFDDDDTLAYDPETTAAFVLCGDDAEAEAAALEACAAAEIGVVVRQSAEQAPTEYLVSGKK